jgi:hypothetical protein
MESELCRVHRSFIAMSGRSRPYALIAESSYSKPIPAMITSNPNSNEHRNLRLTLFFAGFYVDTPSAG